MQILFSCLTWYFEQSIEGSLFAGLGTLEQYGSSLHFFAEPDSPLTQTWFSSEVTKEANACELGHFVDLSASNEEWAEQILSAVEENMPVRRSHANEVARAGFDSRAEALKLQEYYFNAIKEINYGK